MSLILLYAQDMFRYVLIAIPIYAVLRFAYLKTKATGTTIRRELLLGLSVLYAVGLLSQTVLPPGYYGFENGEFYAKAIIRTERHFNLIPLRTIWGYVQTDNELVSDWGQVANLNLLANILLFAPIGFLLPLLRPGRVGLKHVAVAGLAISGGIEIIQFFTGRSADVDDVLLNLLGVCSGYLALVAYQRFRNRVASDAVSE